MTPTSPPGTLPTTSPPGTSTHPSLEEMAAFLDGALPEKDRARVVEHLADCQDCYEIFAGAARFQEDSLAEEPEKDSVIPFPPQQRPQVRQWLPLAAAALLATAVGVSAYRAYMAPPDMAVGNLTAAYQEDAEAASSKLRLGPSYRGGESTETSALDRDAFRLGVQVTNLQVSLQADDRKTSSDIILPNIRRLLESEYFYSMSSSIQGYGQIRTEIDEGRPSREILEQASEQDAEVKEWVGSPYFDLGKWTAAARLAAVTQNANFFDRRDNRRFPSWFLRKEGESLEPQVAATLREIQQFLEEDEIDYAALKPRLETILTAYDD